MAIKKHMQDDIVWFEASYSRYLLIDYMVQYAEYSILDKNTNEIVSLIEEQLLYLEKVSVTKDTVSPATLINQRLYIEHYRSVLSK
jgi:hypothetical protein